MLDVLRRLNSKPFLAVLFSYDLYCEFWLNMYLFAKLKLIFAKLQKLNLSYMRTSFENLSCQH